MFYCGIITIRKNIPRRLVATMKAFVKTERKYGAVEFKDIPKPEPKGDQCGLSVRNFRLADFLSKLFVAAQARKYHQFIYC